MAKVSSKLINGCANNHLNICAGDIRFNKTMFSSV